MCNLKFNLIDKSVCNNLQLDSLLMMSLYYQEYYKDQMQDLSFLFSDDEKILGYVICYKLDKKMCLPNDGINIIFVTNYIVSIKQIYKAIFNYIMELAKQHGCIEIIIKDNLLDANKISGIGEMLFNEKFNAKITFEMVISYENFNETMYRANIRKSYKSFINWGKNNLSIEIVNKNNQCLESFLQFKNFHLKVAGKKTRTDNSWMLQYKLIQQGFGELILAYYKNDLVAGSLFADWYDTSIYFTGVYERELFNFGVSHYLLYYGICRSYERGNTSKFSLGYFDTDIKDHKWYNIQFFKKGFCEKLVPTILWSYVL